MYYNFFTGGFTSIEKLGFDINIRGELFDEKIIEFISKHSNNKCVVRIAGTDPDVFKINKYFNVLQFNIESAMFQKNWDFLILLNHKSLFEAEDFFYWNNIKPDLEKKKGGVRLWGIWQK